MRFWKFPILSETLQRSTSYMFFICSLSSLLRLVLPNIRKQLFTIIRTALGRDYEENTQ